MRLIGRLAAPAAAAVLAVAAAGCGSDNNSSAQSATNDWADGVCSAIATWQSSVKSSTADVRAGNVSKAAVNDAADQAVDATNTLVDDLQGLGKPDLPAGQEAKKTLDTLATQLQSGLDKIETAVKGASSIVELAAAAPAIGATITTMKDELSSAVDTLKGLDAKGELEDAFKQSDSCQNLSLSG